MISKLTNKIVFATLICLFGACSRKDSTLVESSFAISNIEDIGKICLFKRNGETNILSRDGENWLLNGKYKAYNDPVDNLLKAIKTVRLSYVPLIATEKSIIKDLADIGIKTEIYDKKGKLMKCYYVGGGDLSGESTYFIMDKSNKPYAVNIPSLIGLLRPRYDLDSTEWRSRNIFPFHNISIQKLEMQYASEPLQSFSFSLENGQYAISKLNGIIFEKSNKNLIDNYIRFLQDATAEGIINKNPDKVNYTSIAPFAAMKIIDTQGRQYGLTFHKDELDMGFEGQDANATKGNNIFRLYVRTSWGDYYIAQYPVIKDLFRPFDYFLVK